MGSRRAWDTTVFVLTVCVGCGGEPRGGPRVDTFPVSGTVLVNGSPAAGLLVAIYPQGQSEINHQLVCTTDDQGKFSVGTYEAADGLPKGEYKLTFEWMEGAMLGPKKDKLKGKYSDPEKSEFSVTVTEGEENDLGEIQLKAK